MIIVFSDINELSQFAANLFVKNSSQSIAKRGRFLVALSGGNTPMQLYSLLGDSFHDQVDWTHSHFFWGDERCVPDNDPGSSYGQARETFLRHVPIPDSNIHCVDTSLPPAQAAQAYIRTLNQFATPPLEFPRFDLIYLGMGEDGHTASLFPAHKYE